MNEVRDIRDALALSMLDQQRDDAAVDGLAPVLDVQDVRELVVDDALAGHIIAHAPGRRASVPAGGILASSGEEFRSTRFARIAHVELDGVAAATHLRIRAGRGIVEPMDPVDARAGELREHLQCTLGVLAGGDQ